MMKFWLLGALFLFSVNSQASLVLQDTEGQRSTFSSLKGKWVLLHYWAAWCPTCLDEISVYNRFYKSHKHKAFALFGVNYDALPLEQQKKLIKALHIQYPSLVRDPAKALGLRDIIGLPVTFIFNPQGVLVKTLYGAQTIKTLEGAMTI